MKSIHLIVVAALQILSIHAMAMGQRLHSEGNIEVTQDFVVTGLKQKGERQVRGSVDFPRGTYKINFGQHSQRVEPKCVPFLGCGDGDVKYDQYVDLTKGKGPSIQFLAPIDSSKDGQTLVVAAGKSKQSFNIFYKTSTEIKKLNYTSGPEECSIVMTCGDYGRSYLPFGVGYGDGCRYAMGMQIVHRHEEKTIVSIQAKFTDKSNRVIATYKGVDDSTENQSIVDRTEKCILNKDLSN